MSTLDRWIIGILLSALAGILWFLIMDQREMSHALFLTAASNTNRITALESRLEWLEKGHADVTNELREHRKYTESHH